MNEVISTIMRRRSCRTFDPARMPSDDILRQIAEAGTWSPTSRGCQNPIIVAVTNRELRDRISRMNAAIMGSPDADPFYGAPCMLIVLVRQSENAAYDGPIVMQTMMLAAESLGVNSCWIHRAKEEFESPEGRQILRDLGIEGEYIGIGHLALGYTTQPIPDPKPRKADWIHWAKTLLLAMLMPMFLACSQSPAGEGDAELCDTADLHEYRSHILATNEQILRHDTISLADALCAMPASPDQIFVLYGEQATEEGDARANRIDSVCFNFALAGNIDMIAAYVVAEHCSDGYVGEIYLSETFELWKRYPAIVESCTLKLFGQEYLDFALGQYQEWAEWEAGQSDKAAK